MHHVLRQCSCSCKVTVAGPSKSTCGLEYCDQVKVCSALDSGTKQPILALMEGTMSRAKSGDPQNAGCKQFSVCVITHSVFVFPCICICTYQYRIKCIKILKARSDQTKVRCEGANITLPPWYRTEAKKAPQLMRGVFPKALVCRLDSSRFPIPAMQFRCAGG